MWNNRGGGVGIGVVVAAAVVVEGGAVTVCVLCVKRRKNEKGEK